ncbi:MAG TPA: glycosyltransferase family 4 protein [Rubricoccaceae bacterium]
MALQILHLAAAHAATDPRIAEKECRALAEAGHDVAFVVPHDRDESLGGVRILGVPRPRSGKERMVHTTRAVVRRALAEARGRETVFHVHEADLLPFVLPLAARGRRVVYDAHEDTPRQTFHQAWIPRPARLPVAAAYSALETLAGRLCTGIVAATPTIADRYPARKTTLVRNFPVLTDAPDPPFASREALVAYVGAVTAARGADEMVRAAALLPDGARLAVAGTPFPASLPERLAGLPGFERTSLLGPLARPAIADLLARARVGLVALHATPQYRDAYPTKLFEYMAAGLPVVATDVPLWRSVVEGAGCGLLVNPLDPTAIAGACTRLLTDDVLAARMGAAGREAALARFSWRGEGERLVRFYEALAARRAPGQPRPAL